MKFSSTLSVSSKKKLQCENIADFLGKAGIMVDVTSNITMLPNKEYGCRFVQSIQNKDEIKHTWEILKNKYNFTCAHLNIQGKYNGCVLDFIQPTLCPDKS